jgi:hypothetical protein
MGKTPTDAQIRRITIRLTRPEKDTLVEYCNMVGRNQSELIREFIRKLDDHL